MAGPGGKVALQRAVETGEPQIVTKHGEPIAAMIDFAEYRHLRFATMSFMDHLGSGPTVGELPIERSADAPRDVDLVG